MKILERFSPLKVPSSWKPIQKGQSLAFFLDHLITGLYNPVVKRLLRKSDPTNMEETPQNLLRITACERQSVSEGYGEST